MNNCTFVFLSTHDVIMVVNSVLKIETDCSSEITLCIIIGFKKIGSNYDYDQRQWVSLSILKTSPLFFQSNSNITLYHATPNNIEVNNKYFFNGN